MSTFRITARSTSGETVILRDGLTRAEAERELPRWTPNGYALLYSASGSRCEAPVIEESR